MLSMIWDHFHSVESIYYLFIIYDYSKLKNIISHEQVAWYHEDDFYTKSIPPSMAGISKVTWSDNVCGWYNTCHMYEYCNYVIDEKFHHAAHKFSGQLRPRCLARDREALMSYNIYSERWSTQIFNVSIVGYNYITLLIR